MARRDFAAALIHSLSALLISALSDFSNSRKIRLSNGYHVSPLPFAAAAAFWSAVAHSVTRDNGTISRFQITRWIDYTVSAALMVFPAAVFCGQVNEHIIGCSVVTMSWLMVLAAVCEHQLLFSGATKEPLEIRAATFTASSGIYVLVWILVAISATEKSEPAIAALLIGSHALFAPLLLAAGLGFSWLQRPDDYDAASTCLSVFCKVLMHWLVFFNTPGRTPSTSNTLAVVAAAASVSGVVLCVHLCTRKPGGESSIVLLMPSE